ncbi:MAG: head decoration protein [Hyphomicrobiales bacterium]|nr:head decoration protein [Hyphomicrobiales bacterium]
MPVLTEGRHAAEFVLSEASGGRSRDTIVIGASQTITPGEVLGRVSVDGGAVTAVAAAVAGNTGNGTLTLADPATGAGVKEGVYRVTCVTAAANGGIFLIEDPVGVTAGDATVGAAYNGVLKFTIADGSADFAVGDQFTVTVAIAAGDAFGQYEALDLAAADGSQIAVAIPLYGVTTGAGATAKIAAITRDAEVNGKILTWPADITAEQKALALQQLAAAGIIVR